MTEEQLQAQCFQWHWNTYPSERGMLHHNNNNSVNRIAGNKMRSMGVVAGVSDFELILSHHILFIEMKTPIGKQSTDQIDFMNKVVARGHVYMIIRTFDEFKSVIKGLYS